MANSITTIQKYLTRALDTVFATESKTAVLENGSKWIDVDFKEAGYVRIMSMLMDGLSDYYRANHGSSASGGYSNYNGVNHNDGYKVGDLSAKWEIKPLRFDRGRQFQVDDMDNEETAGLIIANLLKEFLRTKVVPEVDAIRFSEIANVTYASLGNRVGETPVTTKGNPSEITHLWNKGFEWLVEHEVPEEDQVIFVSPATWTIVANTEEIYKTLTQLDYKSERGIDFHFAAYMGRPIIVVPSDRFFTDVELTQNGYAPKTGSVVINYIIASKRGCVPIVKLEKSKIFGPESVQDFDGYKCNVRIYHDIIIPDNKVPGFYVSVSSTAASTKTSLLNVALADNGDSANYRVVNYFTVPAGIYGTLKYNSSAYTVGSSGSAGTAVEKGGLVPEGASAGAVTYFAIVDERTGLVLAASASVSIEPLA